MAQYQGSSFAAAISHHFFSSFFLFFFIFCETTWTFDDFLHPNNISINLIHRFSQSSLPQLLAWTVSSFFWYFALHELSISKINIPHCIYLALLVLQYLYFITEFTELHDASSMDTVERSLVILLLCPIMNGELSFEVSCSDSMCMIIRVTQSESQLFHYLS